MIIDTGNAIWVGLWGLVLEMGWRNQAETFAVADMCDHVGYFAWRDCWRDCDSGRQYPFVIFFDCRQMRRIRKKPNPWLTG